MLKQNRSRSIEPRNPRPKRGPACPHRQSSRRSVTAANGEALPLSVNAKQVGDILRREWHNMLFQVDIGGKS